MKKQKNINISHKSKSLLKLNLKVGNFKPWILFKKVNGILKIYFTSFTFYQKTSSLSAARRDELLAEGGAAAHGRAEIGEKSVQVVAGQGSVHGATEAGPGQGAQGPAPGHPEGGIRR